MYGPSSFMVDDYTAEREREGEREEERERERERERKVFVCFFPLHHGRPYNTERRRSIV